MRADELPQSVETLDELAGLDVLPDSYRVRDDRAIPDGYIAVQRSGWQDTRTPPAPPRDAMDARRLERTAGWAGARPGKQMWAALAWRQVRRFRGDSRSAPAPAWWPRRTSGRPRACRSARSRARPRAPTRRAASGDPDLDGGRGRAAGGCSWR